MENIIEFKMPYWQMVGNTEYIYTGRVKTFGKTLTEAKGPSGYEGYAYFSNSVITVPHLDKFNTISNIYTGKSGVNITLSGETKTYDMPVYGNDKDTVDQYFLENKTRDGIQYLLDVKRDNNNGNINEFITFVPGLLISDTGRVFGYLKSHVPENGIIEVYLPYNVSTSRYSVEIATGTVGDFSISDHKIIFTGCYNYAQIRLVYGSENVVFSIYTSSNDVQPFEVKIVNQFGD